MTDEEHDSSYAFRFEITHVRLVYVSEGVVVLESCIAGADDNARSFNVPSASIEDVSQVPDSHACESCDGTDEDTKPHLIAGFTPKHDPVLWKHIRGCKIRLTLCPNRTDVE